MEQPKKSNRSYRDVYHADVVKLLHNYGAFTRSQETGKFAQTEPGSADIMVHLNGGCSVEVKTASAGTFQFANWRDNQRLWASDYRLKTHNEYWLALMYEGEGMTTLMRFNFIGMRKPRHLFLVPYEELVQTINQMPQASLPYEVAPGMLKEVQEGNLCAINLWEKYSLMYDRFWTIPQEHPFYELYIKGHQNA